MTTESLITKPESAVRVAPTVLAGIGAFAACCCVRRTLQLHRTRAVDFARAGAGNVPFAMGAVLVAMSVIWLVQEATPPQ